MNSKVPNPQIGLALGSGLARGWAHIGVLKALERHGIKPDFISGTSIGAVVGSAWSIGKMDVLEDWALDLTRRKVFSYMDLGISRGGLISGKKLFELLKMHFGKTRVRDLPVPMIAVAADMVTGHEVWMQRGLVINAMRASFSLPGVFPPVRAQGRWLIDGALVNPVPVSVCQSHGCKMTIAVNLNADIKGKARNAHGVPTVAGFDPLDDPDGQAAFMQSHRKGLVKRLFKREEASPSLFGTMVGALNIVQDRLARSRLAGDPPDVLIVPRIGHIGPLEFERAPELIAAGEEAVERVLPELKDAIAVFCRD